MMVRSLVVSLSAALGLILTGAAHAIDRSSLKLYGCEVEDFATNADASVTLVACQSPMGLYYSPDFGTTWTSAAGGDYTGGAGKSIAITPNHVFMNFGLAAISYGIFKSPLPVPGAPWSPNWTRVVEEDSFNPTQFVRFQGQVLVAAFRGISVAGASGTAALIRTYDPTTLLELGSSPLPVTGGMYFANIAFDTNFIYALAVPVEFGSPPKLYRATFNGVTGAIGAWTDMTSTIGLALGDSPKNVVALPDGRLLVSGNSHYISNDQAASFVVYNALPTSPLGAARLCRNGSTIVYGRNRSLDNGVTWDAFSVPASAHLSNDFIYNSTCLPHPTDPERWLAKTNLGIHRTDGLSDLTPAWESVIDGLEGVEVQYGVTSPIDPDSGVFVTPQGLGISANLRSAAPTWLYPVCPEPALCSGAAGRPQLDFDGQNPAVFYFINSVGGKIFRGEIGGAAEAPTVQWTLLRASPPEASNDYFIRQPRALQGVLVAGSRFAASVPSPAIDGALHFLSASNGSPIRTVLDGLPVSDFIAITPTLMFAAVRHGFFTTTIADDPEGIYKSTDGGTTWGRVSGSPDVGTVVDVAEFFYDSSSDILYARGVKKSGPLGYIFFLRNASQGGDGWELMPNAGMQGLETSPSTAFGVDVETGTVYVALWRQVYGTNDFGATWRLFFTGLVSERINSLGFLAAPQSSAVRAAATGSEIFSASTFGVQKFSSKLSPPSKGKATCTIKAAKNCKEKKKRKGGGVCTLTTTFRYSATAEPINAPFRLERATSKKAKKWNGVKAGTLGSDGKVAVTVKRLKTFFYRMSFAAPQCKTTVVKVEP